MWLTGYISETEQNKQNTFTYLRYVGLNMISVLSFYLLNYWEISSDEFGCICGGCEWPGMLLCPGRDLSAVPHTLQARCIPRDDLH